MIEMNVFRCWGVVNMQLELQAGDELASMSEL